MNSERHKYTLEQLGMAVRPAQEGDYGFIYDSMINSYHKGSPETKCIRMSVFKKFIRNLLDKLVSPATTIIVCSSTDPSIIHGWAAMDGSRLVYIYTQHLFRSKGVATAMLDLLQPTSFACWTFAFRNIARFRNLDHLPLSIKPIE